MANYDKWGFDEDGFNREGFNRMGFDREGYNKQGYDIHGFNRQGINQKTLRDKDGYDINGYDKDGYNREGLDKDGYDIAGYNIDGFDRNGFDCHGYDKDGYDKEGYSEYGLNRNGYDREGYDINGFDKEGRDREGFDREGFDKDGFDKKGFNKNGFDKEGYDKYGFNNEGIDKDGYNRFGFDKNGYDRKGFDKAGFDKTGFDAEGYNLEGFDKSGYDRKGYDKNGFDKAGFDRDGFDRWGFNKSGLDRNGFNIFGYDKSGFNILGYDTEGFNREQIHKDGFLKSDFDNEGFHIYTGFNLKGYDREGFNINGFNEAGYDREGFNIEGFNKNGYDRNGYNKNGYDIRGFDFLGFNLSGYDKEGYDREGFNASGRDREGFDKNGYDREGFDRYGYDINGKQKRRSINDLKKGMTVYHYIYGPGKILRFEKESKNHQYIVLKFPYLKEEYTYAFPDDFMNHPKPYLSLDITDKMRRKEESYSEVENSKEAKWYSDLSRYLRGSYLDTKLRRAEIDFKPSIFRYFDKSGFLQEREVGIGLDDVQDEVKREVNALIWNPYFAHIDYAKNANLYIGKQTIPGYVIDWADKKASMYYQYQMYIGNRETQLRLVRDIDFGGGKYLGYSDLYNSVTNKKGLSKKYVDDRLAKIISSNQKNKKVHDIIETIQQNQYEIITQDKESNLLVLGCAGSGKTMILMHRIRYMKYNEPELDMHKVFVISPTDVLGKESQELSKILQVGSIQQMTMDALYLEIINDILEKDLHEPNLLHNSFLGVSGIDFKLYDEEVLNHLLSRILLYLDTSTMESFLYRKRMGNSLDQNKRDIYDKLGGYRAFQHLQSLSRKAKEEIDNLSIQDLERVIYRCDINNEEIDKVNYDIKFAELVYTYAGVEDGISSENTQSGDLSGFLIQTKRLASFVELDELYRYLRKNEVIINSISSFIQFICAFEKNPNEKKITEILLLNTRKELSGCTKKQLFEYISSLRKKKSNLEQMPRKANILRFLIKSKMVNKSTISRLNDQQILTAGNDIMAFFEAMHWENDNSDPFADFFKYEKIQERVKRLSQFENGNKWCFLQDLILSEIHVNEIGGRYQLNSSQVFAFCYLLQKITKSRRRNKNYYFIDEFQDFSNCELELLLRFFPNSVFNFFGDFQQCINPKGIASFDELRVKGYITKTYYINENYRNAINITEYVNKRFNINMLGIGLKGSVEESNIIMPMKLEKGDRGAIIVPDDYKEQIELKDQKVFFYLNENYIYRDSYNVIPVSLAKGLEFEKVIVVTQGMTENQKYVACTRAIKNLEVVL